MTLLGWLRSLDHHRNIGGGRADARLHRLSAVSAEPPAAVSAFLPGLCATSWPTDQLAGKHGSELVGVRFSGFDGHPSGLPPEITADDTLEAVV